MAFRRDARFTLGPYSGKYVVAESGDGRSITALICEGEPGSLVVIGDWWFVDNAQLEAGLTEGGWAVEWLPSGSLGTPM